LEKPQNFSQDRIIAQTLSECKRKLKKILKN